MRPDTVRTYKQRILRALVHIQERLDEPLSLEELARVACFSPYHFHRVFAAMVGEPVMEHVRRLRLERAAHRLLFGDEPVTAIAFAAGYEAHESFTRAFRAMFGASPSAYRKRQWQEARAPAPSGVHYQPEGRLEDFDPVPRGGPLMDVRIESIAPMKVAFLRHVGPYEDEALGRAWGRLMAWAGQRGLLGPGSKLLGIDHDNPHVTPPDRLRYDACVVIERPVEPEGEVGSQVIPGGEYAVVTHQGPYERMPETFARLYGEWLPTSGREPADAPCFQHYRNTPRDAAPEGLLTDVYTPLRPR